MTLLRPALALALLSSAALVRPAAIGRAAASPSRTVRVAINDNRRPAGRLHDGVLTLRLDARLGEWHPDGDDAPGAVVPAFAEEGGAPSIPGPLVRVPVGTVVALSIRNALDQPLTLRGVHDRVSNATSGIRDSTIVVAPGGSTSRRIRLDVPGTYYYYGSTNGRSVDWRSGPDAQLGGAIVVDPPGARPKIDRVFVLGLWADTAGKVLMRRTRILAVVNGRSWPHTERLDYAVGDTVRFHVLNASSDAHPMHLHGFYFRVDGRGDGSSDTTYAPDNRRRVNTEDLLPGMTMTMTWVPERPGNWLFHCHLPDHFSARGSLGMPRVAQADATAEDRHAAMNHATTGMNGLVVGITVHGGAARPAPVASRASRALRLVVRPSAGGSAEQPFYAFALDRNGVVPPPDSGLHTGPPLVLTRDEPVRITVVNTLDVPTSVHWHGIELESFFDGVAGFSGAGQRLAPIIAPHDSFVVRFTPPRAGTFMYHTHVDETRQQLAGLAGPLIVLEPGRTFDPATDHAVLITTPPAWSDELRSVLLNGSAAPPPMELRPGVAQRFRFINITTRRPNIHVELWRDSTLLSWRPLAKDGADLPATRQVAGPARTLITIGDTRDFEFVPEPGADLTLLVRAATGAVLVRQSLRVTDPRSSFQRLLDDHWQWVLRESPILATTLGEHRYDRELGDLTVGAMDRRAREAAAFLGRANALDTTSLTASERVSLAILRRGLSEDVEGNRFGQRTVLFTTYYGWHTGFADIGTTHPFRDRADYEA
ncbi:MAG TPA: DUF885 family protein, partial [Gemmatimonadaceae bacterium]|nr:DUF885 family protein [Gemmatimonadaceae bacterium]